MCIFDCIKLREKQKYTLYISVYFLLALFAGLRLTSPDYEAYELYFKLLNAASSRASEITIVSTDWGFVLINEFLGIFTQRPVVLFLTMAFLSVGINLSCYRKYTPYFFTAILFYFVHTFVAREMMQIRAGLACAICLYSIRFIVSRNLKKFLITIAIAATIHLAALIFVVTYLGGKIDISRRTWICLVAGSLGVGMITPLGQYLKMLPYIDGLERIQNYSQWEGYNQTLGVFSNPTIIKQLVISCFCLFYFEKLDKRVYGFKVCLHIYLFSLCWLSVWNDFGIIAARIATFFSISEVLLLASLFTLFEHKSKYIYVGIVCIIAFLIMSLNIYTGRFFEYQLLFC